jgi:beta-carotene ketolase (CrtW type)
VGVVVACTVLIVWLGSLAALLVRGVAGMHPALVVVLVLGRTWLTTGLFITAHDAMHRSVSRHRLVNDTLGYVACFLFAAMSYGRLVRNHGLHHAAPGTADDPDYCARSQSFPVWFLTFMLRYTTVLQVVTMAALYNILHLRVDDGTLWAFWVGPALLASVQLFLFGTYLPHRPPHPAAMGEHRARSLRRGHAVALLTCFFFGYHREHHEGPGVPWWRLWQAPTSD